MKIKKVILENILTPSTHPESPVHVHVNVAALVLLPLELIIPLLPLCSQLSVSYFTISSSPPALQPLLVASLPGLEALLIHFESF